MTIVYYKTLYDDTIHEVGIDQRMEEKTKSQIMREVARSHWEKDRRDPDECLEQVFGLLDGPDGNEVDYFKASPIWEPTFDVEQIEKPAPRIKNERLDQLLPLDFVTREASRVIERTPRMVKISKAVKVFDSEIGHIEITIRPSMTPSEPLGNKGAKS